MVKPISGRVGYCNGLFDCESALIDHAFADARSFPKHFQTAFQT